MTNNDEFKPTAEMVKRAEFFLRGLKYLDDGLGEIAQVIIAKEDVDIILAALKAYRPYYQRRN